MMHGLFSDHLFDLPKVNLFEDKYYFAANKCLKYIKSKSDHKEIRITLIDTCVDEDLFKFENYFGVNVPIISNTVAFIVIRVLKQLGYFVRLVEGQDTTCACPEIVITKYPYTNSQIFDTETKLIHLTLPDL